MKPLITLFCTVFLFVLFSCKKTTTPTTPTSSNPPQTGWNAQARFIPNWWNNDTLVAITLDSNNNANGYDTIYTKTVSDTSFIIYRGKQYYIWKEPLSGSDTFKTNEMQYVNVYISPDKNINNAISKSALNGAAPYKYKDQLGNWSYQKQVVMINDYTNFKKTNAGYYGAITLHH